MKLFADFGDERKRRRIEELSVWGISSAKRGLVLDRHGWLISLTLKPAEYTAN